MPSDSIAGFLDLAQASRVLFPEQVEQLIRQPDIPQTDLGALCAYLEERGALTRFQAAMLREGRGEELTFAGYPVLDEIGPCPGGTAYRALHPSFRTPVQLRRFRADALFPSDTTHALVQRAQAAAAVHHPYLVTLLDAGMHRGEAYAAIDLPADAGPLDVLVHEIGAMPGFLAAEYGRQTAAALRAAHERGLWHGDVRPANLLVGPMTGKPGPDGAVKRRPAPNAAVRVAELGLVPVRPPVSEQMPPDEALPYLPPERTGGYIVPDTRGDLYGLGATLYHLLTGRPPFVGSSAAEVLDQVRTADPPPLAALRPDLPAGFAALVHHLLSKQPEYRPLTAFDVEQALIPFCRPGSVPAPAAPSDSGPVLMAVPPSDVILPGAEARPAPADEWGTSEAFSTAHAAAGPAPRRQLSAQDKTRTRLLVILGLCLHLSAVGLLIAWLSGAFDSTPTPEPAPTKHEQHKPPKRVHRG